MYYLREWEKRTTRPACLVLRRNHVRVDMKPLSSPKPFAVGHNERKERSIAWMDECTGGAEEKEKEKEVAKEGAKRRG